ncbi:hypothetical protein [Clostridium hydrogenum]|uniref:hypothetical protein n=1 Tax=Clostridium hydrogenum TaxID=2855764 RepID=UPI001F2F5702|nr:hypothetical protein [Clostridium hydrogenum]
MKKKLILIICLILIIGIVVINVQDKNTITSDNFNSNIEYIDKNKNIADEMEFDYKLRKDNKSEFNIYVKSNNSQLNLKSKNEIPNSKIFFDIVNSKNKTIKSIQLGKNYDSKFPISKGTYKIYITFKSGTGKGKINWVVQ